MCHVTLAISCAGSEALCLSDARNAAVACAVVLTSSSFFFFSVLLRVTFFQYLKVSIFFLNLVSLQHEFYFLFCYLRSFPATQKKGRVQQILSRDFPLLAYYCSVVCMYVCVCVCVYNFSFLFSLVRCHFIRISTILII